MQRSPVIKTPQYARPVMQMLGPIGPRRRGKDQTHETIQGRMSTRGKYVETRLATQHHSIIDGCQAGLL